MGRWPQWLMLHPAPDRGTSGLAVTVRVAIGIRGAGSSVVAARLRASTADGTLTGTSIETTSAGSEALVVEGVSLRPLQVGEAAVS